jgi:predicted nucleic acid-binding Zn ribbon protein
MPLCSTCQCLISALHHHCPQCGATQRVRDAAVEAEDSWRVRARERRRNHAITGMLLIAILQLLFGLPHSLFPTSLLLIAVQSVLIGAPLGWLVSVAGGGVPSGAAIGAGFGLILAVIGGIFGGGSVLAAGLLGFASGLLPGAIMGWHVEHDL